MIFFRKEPVISNLSQMIPIADICYVSVVLKVDSEPVISFFNKDKLFEGLPFLIFDANFIIYSQFNLTSLSIIIFF